MSPKEERGPVNSRKTLCSELFQPDLRENIGGDGAAFILKECSSPFNSINVRGHGQNGQSCVAVGPFFSNQTTLR